jgi:hypothetical protein
LENQFSTMINLRFTLFCIIFCWSTTIFSQHTDVINSNRPGQSMGAFAVGKTVIQLETGLNYLSEKHSLLDYDAKGFGLDLDIRYGFLREQLETTLQIEYQKDEFTSPEENKSRVGLKNTTIGAKYLVYDPFKYYEEKVNLYSWKANRKFKWRQLIPAVSVFGGLNLNFNSNFVSNNLEMENLSYKAMLITQNHFTNGFVLVTNIYADRITSKFQSLEYIVTLTKGFNDQWSGFLENRAIKGDYYSDVLFRFGAAYLMNENLQFDASFTKNYKGTPAITYGGIGLSWRSTTRYKDVMIRSKKDDKKKKKDDKSVKGKNKKEAKKRLDEIEVKP